MPPESFDIRYSELADLSFLQSWFEGEDACDPFPFDPEEKEMALKNWIGFAKYKASLTGTLDGKPCAIGTLFLMPYRKVAHHCSFYLIVDPEHRRKEIGTSMVRNLLNLAKNRFKLESVHVEIYFPTPLFSILKKTGFHLIATQENFVKLHGESRERALLEYCFD
jgi:RimJ/RimL family protein N-acetyltransferase